MQGKQKRYSGQPEARPKNKTLKLTFKFITLLLQNEVHQTHYLLPVFLPFFAAGKCTA
jgi:hypothetical protein